jgi:RNA-binding protein 39
MSKELGGKIFCAFENIDGARACAENLAGRWFDKRQLKVEFVSDDVFSSTDVAV